MRSIFIREQEPQEVDFGYIRLTLRAYLDANNLTRNQLSVNTGIKYQTIDRYYKCDTVDRADLVLLAKICFVLGCDLPDIIAYIPPKSNGAE